MIVKLLTEHHLECLSLKGGCRGSSETTLVKMPHCWKSHALAHLMFTVAKQCILVNSGTTVCELIMVTCLCQFVRRSLII